MFAQVIEGRTSDVEGLRAALDRWVQELGPGAIGWLGSTAGGTDDGRFIAVARFESADAAAQNSQRPEQGRWWEQTRQHFEGDIAFRDSEDVTVDLVGDPAQAGFVQVMQGRVTDPERAKELMAQMPIETMAAFRPDLLGSVMITHGDGGWTEVIYFTSEAAARAGERLEAPLELRATMEQLDKISIGETDYLDLRQPVLQSPR